MQKPSDEEIIAAVKVWGGVSAAYVVFDRLRPKGYDISTPWVIRQLKRLEREGKVRRVPTSYAVMISRENSDAG